MLFFGALELSILTFKNLRPVARWVHFEKFTSKFSPVCSWEKWGRNVRAVQLFNSSLDESTVGAALGWSSSLGQQSRDSGHCDRCCERRTDGQSTGRHSAPCNRNILLFYRDRACARISSFWKMMLLFNAGILRLDTFQNCWILLPHCIVHSFLSILGISNLKCWNS